MNQRDTMYRTQIVMYTLYNRHNYISINYMSLYMHGVREIINLIICLYSKPCLFKTATQK